MAENSDIQAFGPICEFSSGTCVQGSNFMARRMPLWMVVFLRSCAFLFILKKDTRPFRIAPAQASWTQWVNSLLWLHGFPGGWSFCQVPDIADWKGLNPGGLRVCEGFHIPHQNQFCLPGLGEETTPKDPYIPLRLAGQTSRTVGMVEPEKSYNISVVKSNLKQLNEFFPKHGLCPIDSLLVI